MNNEDQMGDSLRSGYFPSMEGLLYFPRAPRINIPQGLFWSDVDVTDVSFWQGEIDFVKMKKSGIKGTFIRAGQRLWFDKRFDVNWKAAKEAGLPRGSYWFFDSRADPKAQADLYCDLLGKDRGELPLVVDYEENYKGSFAGWKNLYNFLERLMGGRNRVARDRIWIYTGYWYWMANSPQNPAALNYFSKFPLWIAAYTRNPDRVRIPKPWKDAIMWQWGTPSEGKDRGVDSLEIDMDKFTGTEDEFNQLRR